METEGLIQEAKAWTECRRRTVLEIVARRLLCIPCQDVELVGGQEPFVRVLAVRLGQAGQHAPSTNQDSYALPPWSKS